MATAEHRALKHAAKQETRVHYIETKDDCDEAIKEFGSVVKRIPGWPERRAS